MAIEGRQGSTSQGTCCHACIKRQEAYLIKEAQDRGLCAALTKWDNVQASAHAGPAPGTGTRPGSAKRVYIALSGLHTGETVKYKRLLQELKIGHTTGLEKHV